MMPAACAKYQCKTDRTKFLRVLTLASAFWALQSLGRQGDRIGIARQAGDERRLLHAVLVELADPPRGEALDGVRKFPSQAADTLRIDAEAGEETG